MGVLQHCVYIVMCADGTLYTGYTTDLSRRLEEHNTGEGARYTRQRIPVVLIHFERFRSRGEALRREIEIKKMTRKEKLLLCSS